MPAPAYTGGVRCTLPKPYRVRVTLADGQRLEYHALARCSVDALQSALEMHGPARSISVSPKGKTK